MPTVSAKEKAELRRRAKAAMSPLKSPSKISSPTPTKSKSASSTRTCKTPTSARSAFVATEKVSSMKDLKKAQGKLHAREYAKSLGLNPSAGKLKETRKSTVPKVVGLIDDGSLDGYGTATAGSMRSQGVQTEVTTVNIKAESLARLYVQAKNFYEALGSLTAFEEDDAGEIAVAPNTLRSLSKQVENMLRGVPELVADEDSTMEWE